MNRPWRFGALAALLLAAPALAQLPESDRLRLAEARRLTRAIQDSVWPGWDAAPFALLLVTDSLELLLWHPRPSADFRSLGHDSLLGTDVLARPRTFPPNLLATFPAVGGIPTIVLGQPAKTGKTSTEWVLSVLHEHFHQLQTSRPGYYAAVDSLGLARGDQTGMWMLNYPFPYDSAPVQRLFATFSETLAAALVGSGEPRAERRRAYAAAHAALRGALAEDDYRYLRFQLWQEGVARYVEYRSALVAARSYTPTAAFTALPDYITFGEAAARHYVALLRDLSRPTLGANRRVSFYAAGAATALLLDRIAPRWKDRYFTPMLTLDPEIARATAPR